jgi:hypothetical protein
MRGSPRMGKLFFARERGEKAIKRPLLASVMKNNCCREGNCRALKKSYSGELLPFAFAAKKSILRARLSFARFRHFKEPFKALNITADN